MLRVRSIRSIKNFTILFLFCLCNYLLFTSVYRKHQNDISIDLEALSFSDNDLHEKTEQVRPPHPGDSIPEVSQNWMNIEGTKEKFFVYSAYYDPRNLPSIRIIAATLTSNPDKVWCRFWYDHPKDGLILDPHPVVAMTKTISEHWNLKYSATFVRCPLQNLTNIPTFVSVVNNADSTLDQMKYKLVVQNREINHENIPFKISVCVKPMHYDYNNIYYLLEFFELYSILGVRHFTLYNHTVGSEVDCLLRDYLSTKSDITVEILPWMLDMVSQKEIRTEGIFASLNDCLYHHMYKYSHMIPIDLDEFIIPHEHANLRELILSLESQSPNAAAFLFQNAFFYKQHPDDLSAFDINRPISAHLLTLIKTRKKTALNKQRERSKYICRPERTIELGNHFLWQSYNNHETVEVSSAVAFLHHYRVCEFGGDDCVNQPWQVDQSTYRFKDELIDRTTAKFKKVQNTCNLPDISLPKNYTIK